MKMGLKNEYEIYKTIQKKYTHHSKPHPQHTPNILHNPQRIQKR